VHAPSEEKCDTSKDSFYAQLEQVFYHLPKYHMKILLGDFNAKLGGRKFLNQQSDRRVSIGIVMIIGLEYLTSPHPKIWWLRALCSFTGTFINIPGPALTVRLTTRLTTY
jgi:hypothetical protein